MADAGNDIVIGKHVLESLSTGMYSDPKAIFREYIQNATDSIDKAIAQGLISTSDIHIQIDKEKRRISIRDNGQGIPADIALKKLCDVGNSGKNYETERGFRGIGRLGGLAYATTVFFVTSAKGENKKSVLEWDCEKMRKLLAPSNREIEDIVGVIEAITSFHQESEEPDEHYFEVILENVIPSADELLDETTISEYLAAVAPVDFDEQKFIHAREIKKFYAEKDVLIPTYNIYFNNRKLPIYKPYTRTLNTGAQERTREKDFVRRVEPVYGCNENGKLLYIGWLAITDFSGQISDERLQGIRLRKQNILVGDNSTFARFFPSVQSEGVRANKMFAGEIHILDPDVLPNSQRDDFEPNAAMQVLAEKFGAWAGEINKKYRRGTSEATSALRDLSTLEEDQTRIEREIETGAISSDTKRDKLVAELDRITKKRERATSTVKKALERGTIDQDRAETVERSLNKATAAAKKIVALTNKVVNADYATKNDLPSSYNRDERKLYQRIIEIIDMFFENDPETAKRLRTEIVNGLKVKKK